MTRDDVVDVWRERLDAFDQDKDGVSARAWCARHDISLERFYHWRRRLRSEAQADNVGWLTVGVTAAPDRVVISSKSTPTVSVRIGEATIDVRPGFDPALLRAVARSLGTGPC